MKKRGVLLVFAIILIYLSALVIVSSDENQNKIDSNIYQKISKDNQTRVIITLKNIEQDKILKIINRKNIENIRKDLIKKLESKNKKKVKIEINHTIVIEINEGDITTLLHDQNIESVKLDKEAKIFLQDSVPLINASTVWTLQPYGINLTGIGETVCIIDTGINSSHPDLANNTIAEYCYCSNYESGISNCCPGDVGESNNATDNHGHGTHVSGIVAANGGIKGVAPGAKIVAIKTLNSSGSGYYSDIKLGIDWCVNNASIFNISVISLSLGSDSYTTYCNDDYLADSINSAVAKNISVVVATGNDGYTNKISSPACIQNSTAVGATSKLDAITSYSNRNNITDLVAPGGLSTNSQTKINSTYKNGGYAYNYGTSMSTPHVAGAFILLRQFIRNQENRTPTPQEIEYVLNKTGKIIPDTGSGLNFSRINIYSAILSLDNSLPNVTLSYPPNNLITPNQTIIFECNSSDNILLKNITLKIWDYQNNLYYNTTNTTANNFSSNTFNVTNITNGNYNWNCLVYDLAGNSSYAPLNYSFYIGNISVSLIFPPDNYITQNSTNNLTCFSQTAATFNLTNITFYIWNSSGSLINSTAQNISGITNITTFNINFTKEGNYTWNCISFNNGTQSSNLASNLTITFHNSTPIISSISSSVTSTSATISWTTNEISNSSVNYGTTTGLGIISSSPTRTTSNSISITGLSSSTLYYYNLTSCDIYGLCATNGTYNLTTSQTSSSGTQTTSSSSSTTPSQTTKTEAIITYIVKKEESGSSAGSTKIMAKNDKIKFYIENKNKSEEHILTLQEINNNSVKIKIESEIIESEINNGETKKFELTNDDYYDVQVKLNSITGKKASITIKTINEKMIAQILKNETEINISNNISEQNQTTIKETGTKKITKTLIILLISILIIAIILIIIKKIRKKNGYKRNNRIIE